MCWVICAGQHAAGRGSAPGEGRSKLECFGTFRAPLAMTEQSLSRLPAMVLTTVNERVRSRDAVILVGRNNNCSNQSLTIP